MTHNNITACHNHSFTMISQAGTAYISGQMKQVDTKKSLLSKQYNEFNDSPFKFEHTKDTAKLNSNIIKKFDFNLNDEINSTSPNTHLSYGLEFRPTEDLVPLLQDHKLWTKTKDLMSNGSKIPLQDMDPVLKE